MRKTNTDIRQTDVYKQVYRTHQDIKETDRLRDKFAEKPYRVRFRLLRNLSFGTSILANVLSAATASIAVYFFLNEMLHHRLAAGGLTVLLLFILEIAKRTAGKTLLIDLNRKSGFSLLHVFILVGLTSTSIALSYNGGKRTAEKFIKQPSLYKEEDYTKTYQEELAKIDELIEDARKTTYRGTTRTTTSSQRVIEGLIEDRSKINDKLFEIRAQVSNSNKQIKTDFKADQTEKGRLFALITIFIEFLFLCCMFYVEHYDYKSYIELPVVDGVDDYGVFGAVEQPTLSPSREEIQSLLHEVMDDKLKEVVLPMKEELTKLAATRKSTEEAKNQQRFKQEVRPKQETSYKASTPVSNLKTSPIVSVQKEERITPIKLKPTPQKTTLTLSPEREALKKQIRTKKNGISKAKGRLNSGEGNAETHQKNIAQWTVEVSVLKKELLDLEAADENRQQNT